jgi:NAD(P)H-dependent FMN reductase
MSAQPSVLAIAGSTRRGSWNRKLLDASAHELVRRGIRVVVADLADYPMPLMNQDLEEASGMPEKARELKQLMRAHDGLLVASPEYNGSLTPLLKNTIDWVSRQEPGESVPLVAYRNKVAALLSASPGALGGLRGLVHLRQILSGIGVLVIPEQVAIPAAHEAFTPEGGLADEKLAATLARQADAYAFILKRLTHDGTEPR